MQARMLERALADYIVIAFDGLNISGPLLNSSLMMHEIGHACSLSHSWTVSNIMYRDHERGDGVKWFQQNLFRSSRHVTYW